MRELPRTPRQLEREAGERLDLPNGGAGRGGGIRQHRAEAKRQRAPCCLLRLWVSGGVSELFQAEVKALGWECRSDFRSELLPKLPWTAE